MRKLSTREWLAVSAGVVVVAILLIQGGALSFFNPSFYGDVPGAAVVPTGSLVVQDNVVGTGAEAAPGKELSVHYVGTLEDGTVFDSSRTRGAPFPFTLGARQVIPGWDLGLVGMKVGGTRMLIVPPELGYGDRQNGPIPPNSTLIFIIELLEVRGS